ncbi:MAG: hypothetical protein AB4372_07220 [Xenococcus sp. (in: cyanobacteria)]
MNISIPETTYKELVKHLEINAESDADARLLLEKLQAEAKPNYRLESGAYLLDGKPKNPVYSV